MLGMAEHKSNDEIVEILSKLVNLLNSGKLGKTRDIKVKIDWLDFLINSFPIHSFVLRPKNVILNPHINIKTGKGVMEIHIQRDEIEIVLVLGPKEITQVKGRSRFIISPGKLNKMTGYLDFSK